jgi:hypothetical protein
MLYGYGEDALTLKWLQELGNTFEEEAVIAKFYRPSFGRGRGGYGEPDFLILTNADDSLTIWIGESKWPLISKRGERRSVTFSSLRLRNLFSKRMEGIERLCTLIKTNSKRLAESDKLLTKNMACMARLIRESVKTGISGSISKKCCIVVFHHASNIVTEDTVSDIREKLESEFKGYQDRRPDGIKIILCPTGHLLQGNNENYLSLG